LAGLTDADRPRRSGVTSDADLTGSPDALPEELVVPLDVDLWAAGWTPSAIAHEVEWQRRTLLEISKLLDPSDEPSVSFDISDVGQGT
jgi:hypothetical protein